MEIRSCVSSDYASLKTLYQQAGWFDEETDSEAKIAQQIAKDPNSILLALDGEELIGTVTLLFTGRLGLFFRLIANSDKTRLALLQEGEKIFKKHGYNEVHILALELDKEKQQEYMQYGFKKGKQYRWFWKKID